MKWPSAVIPVPLISTMHVAPVDVAERQPHPMDGARMAGQPTEADRRVASRLRGEDLGVWPADQLVRLDAEHRPRRVAEEGQCAGGIGQPDEVRRGGDQVAVALLGFAQLAFEPSIAR